MKEQKTARDYIAEIIPNKANFEYCGQAGKINGSLLLDIEIAMQEYSDQQNAELRERHKETLRVMSDKYLDLERKFVGSERLLSNALERVKELEVWKNLTRGLINEIENRQTTADLMHIYAEESGVKEKDIAVYEAGFYDGMTLFRRRLNEELK